LKFDTCSIAVGKHKLFAKKISLVKLYDFSDTTQGILRTFRLLSKYVINIPDINECSSNPCKNNGECRDGINMFTCSCSPGFEGTECEISK
jgi:hypothetical protein